MARHAHQRMYDNCYSVCTASEGYAVLVEGCRCRSSSPVKVAAWLTIAPSKQLERSNGWVEMGQLKTREQMANDSEKAHTSLARARFQALQSCHWRRLGSPRRRRRLEPVDRHPHNKRSIVLTLDCLERLPASEDLQRTLQYYTVNLSHLRSERRSTDRAKTRIFVRHHIVEVGIVLWS
jgi:hypothetical protein